MTPNWDSIDLTIMGGLLSFAVMLVWAVAGGLVYWVRKLDDRTHKLAINSATRDDVTKVETDLRSEIKSSEGRAFTAYRESEGRIRDDVKSIRSDLREFIARLETRIDTALTSKR